jgi:hypothetical protein
MRRLIPAIIAAVALLAPATASAHTTYHNCWPSDGFAIQIVTANTTCGQTMTVYRYWVGHDGSPMMGQSEATDA